MRICEMYSFLTKYKLSKLTKASRKLNNAITKVKNKKKRKLKQMPKTYILKTGTIKLRQFYKSSNKHSE